MICGLRGFSLPLWGEKSIVVNVIVSRKHSEEGRKQTGQDTASNNTPQ